MLLAVVLVLLGSLAHAAWNLLAGRVAVDDPRPFVWVYSAVSVVLLAPASVIAVAAGAELEASLVWTSAVSAALHTVYALSLQAAYGRSDVNVTYPVARGLGPVLVALIAVVSLSESLPWQGWLGIAAIAAGVAVVSTGLATSASSAARRRAGVRWGALVGVAIASYTLWDAHVVATLRSDPVLYYAGTGAWMFVLLSMTTIGRYGEALTLARRHWRAAVGVGILTPTAYVLVLVALTMAPVSVVAPLRSTSIVIGSLGAWWWLGESNGARRLVGAGIVTAGVVALVV